MKLYHCGREHGGHTLRAWFSELSLVPAGMEGAQMALVIGFWSGFVPQTRWWAVLLMILTLAAVMAGTVFLFGRTLESEKGE